MHERQARYRRSGLWTGKSLLDRVGAHVDVRPSAKAVISGPNQLSFAELWRTAGAAADTIRSIGEGRRKVVLIILPNDKRWMVSFLATLRAGHVPATAPITTSGEHFRHIIELTDPAVVVTCPLHRHSVPAEKARDIVNAANSSAAVAVATNERIELISSGPGEWHGTEVPEGTDHLMFTSSTTGPPKAVSHSDDSLETLNRQFADRFNLDGTSPIFMPSPLGHSVGAIHGARLSLFLGAPLVLQDEWNAGQALELVAEHRAEFSAAATPYLLDLVKAPWSESEPKLSTLHTFLCGGAQVPPALIRRCRRELPNTFVTPLWGMTEGGVTTCTASTPLELVDTTVGVGLPDLELRVIDDHGLNTSGEGELVMRGPGVFNGYYRQDDLYRQSLTADGFFKTGDLARIAENGYLTITGRLKDLIIRGGVNISPVETENVISAHPDITAVAVIGWPDQRLGERLCAAVQTDMRLDIGDLVAFCDSQGLPKRFWPERLEIVDEFPRTAAGKIRKHQLREDLVARRAGEGAPNTEVTIA